MISSVDIVQVTTTLFWSRGGSSLPASMRNTVHVAVSRPTRPCFASQPVTPTVRRLRKTVHVVVSGTHVPVSRRARRLLEPSDTSIRVIERLILSTWAGFKFDLILPSRHSAFLRSPASIRQHAKHVEQSLASRGAGDRARTLTSHSRCSAAKKVSEMGIPQSCYFTSMLVACQRVPVKWMGTTRNLACRPSQYVRLVAVRLFGR
jgi:hypothetical protein